MSLFSLLNGRNYGVYNRSVAKEIGLKTTVFLSELIDKYEYFLSQEALVSLRDEEGLWFYVLVDDMEDRTTLGEKEQRSCIDHLVALGLIKKTVAGQPAKRYFQINEEKIQQFLISKIKTTRSSQREELVPPKGQTRSCVREELEPPKGRNSHIYKNPIEEPKEIDGAPPPTPHTENFFKNKFDNRVVITKENYDRLLEKFKDANLIESYAEKLHRWSFNNYKAYKDKKRHDMVIEDWIEKDQKENPGKSASNVPIMSWKEKLKERVENHPEITVTNECFSFSSGQYYEAIKFTDGGYKERILSRLRKMTISVDGLV